ncbi:MAG: hypothetical protein ABW032_03840 [Burkholderiaceae bacterium]
MIQDRDRAPSGIGPDLDLDMQIALAEQAVIERDERIRRRADTVVRRVKSNVLRHTGGGLLAGAATVLLAWWFKRRGAAAAPPGRHPAAGAPSEGEHLARDAGLSLAGLLPLIWPFMPHAVRRSVTPGTVGSVLAFISPLISRLFRRKAGAPAV